MWVQYILYTWTPYVFSLWKIWECTVALGVYFLAVFKLQAQQKTTTDFLCKFFSFLIDSFQNDKFSMYVCLINVKKEIFREKFINVHPQPSFLVSGYVTIRFLFLSRGPSISRTAQNGDGEYCWRNSSLWSISCSKVTWQCVHTHTHACRHTHTTDSQPTLQTSTDISFENHKLLKKLMNMNHSTGLRYGFRKRVLINIQCASYAVFQSGLRFS
jgi:hypothetical protein